MAQLAEFVRFDFIFLGFGVVHILLSGADQLRLWRRAGTRRCACLLAPSPLGCAEPKLIMDDAIEVGDQGAQQGVAKHGCKPSWPHLWVKEIHCRPPQFVRLRWAVEPPGRLKEIKRASVEMTVPWWL